MVDMLSVGMYDELGIINLYQLKILLLPVRSIIPLHTKIAVNN